MTASFDRVDFVSPVRVSGLDDFTAPLTYVGRTSPEAGVRVPTEEVPGGPARLGGEALATTVVVDAPGRPLPVSPLVLGVPGNRLRLHEGRRRMEARRRSRRRS